MKIVVNAESGNVRPWRARVYQDDGSFVARTGFCATKDRAVSAAEQIIAALPKANPAA